MEITDPILGKFQLIKKIGIGTFATVYLAKHSILKYFVAVKIFGNSVSEESIINTFSICKQLNHLFICQDFSLTKTEKNEHSIIMEYIEGTTLLDYANKHSPFSESEIQRIFGQLIISIEYLHKHRIIHRDLKCENIMIDKFKNIRLIDLSFSCNNFNKHSTICGSPSYIAPEIILNQTYGNSVDIWSLGVIIYAITFNKLPFENENYSVLFQIITHLEPAFPSDCSYSDNLVDLIKKMLIKNPDYRISIEGIKSHPFFTCGENGNKYFFNEQAIKSFEFDPTRLNSAEMQIINRIGSVSNSTSDEIINDLKSDVDNFSTSTFKILYKNHIFSHEMNSSWFGFLYPLSPKGAKKHQFPKLQIPLNLNTEQKLKTERHPSIGHLQIHQIDKDENEVIYLNSPSSSREVFDLNSKFDMVNHITFGENVQFRRFTTNFNLKLGERSRPANFRKITFSSQMIKKLTAANKRPRDASASLEMLPQLNKK